MARLRPDERDLRFVRRLVLVLVLVALGFFVVRAADLILLAFGAMLGALLLVAIADWIDAHTPIGRGAGLAIAALVLFTVIGLIVWLFGSETASQASALTHALPQDWARLRQSWGSSPIGGKLLNSVESFGGGSKLARVGAGLGLGSLELIANFIIMLVGALFFAAQPQLYRKGILHLVPRPYRPVIADALEDVARALRLWLITQLISMGLMGVMIAFGLWLSGVQAWGALGLLGGLSEFIPYVGPTLAMIPAIIVGLAGGGSIWGVIGTYVVVRIIQANVITPLISQRVVSVPPGLYLFLILAMGYAFGTFGMFFSGALSVAAYTLTIRLYVRETLGDHPALPGET